MYAGAAVSGITYKTQARTRPFWLGAGRVRIRKRARTHTQHGRGAWVHAGGSQTGFFFEKIKRWVCLGDTGSPEQNTARQILRIKLGDPWSSRTVTEREGVLPRPHTP